MFASRLTNSVEQLEVELNLPRTYPAALDKMVARSKRLFTTAY